MSTDVILTSPNPSGCPSTIAISRFGDAGHFVAKVTALPASTCSKTAPPPAITLVANAEGASPTIAPNMWVEIQGSNLAQPDDTRIWHGSDFVGNTMPTKPDAVSATVNGALSRNSTGFHIRTGLAKNE